jgi:hypothetical protein
MRIARSSRLRICANVCAFFFFGAQVQLRVDELAAHAHSTQLEGEGKEAGSQFTCFTGTKVQILTQLEAEIAAAHSNLEVCALVYLLYWYKRTNTDAGSSRDSRGTQ